MDFKDKGIFKLFNDIAGTFKPSKAKSLVTGASGFIGSHIAENLVKRGQRVRALVRKTSKIDFLESIGAEICYGDLNDAASLREAVKGMDKVFHSAAMVGDWMPKKTAQKINVEGTKYLLEASLNEGIKRFVFVSSLGVLGMKHHHKTSSDAPRIKANDPYIDTKIDSEALVIDYCQKNKLPFTVIRPGFVFGPRDTKVIPRIVAFLKKEKFVFIGSGSNKVNMVYAENLADAVVDASNSDKAIGQVYNITNDSNMSIMDVVHMISDIWGLKKPNKHVPAPLAYMLCNIMELFAKATKAKKAPLLNKTRLKFLNLNLDFDIEKIKQDLGYDPKINMAEGLIKTKKWIEQEALV